MHVASFSVYMTVLGACGILDHSGIDMRVPGVSDQDDQEGGGEAGGEAGRDGVESVRLSLTKHNHIHSTALQHPFPRRAPLAYAWQLRVSFPFFGPAA